MLREGFLYLSRKDVIEACTTLDSVTIMRDVFRLHGSGQTILPDEAYLSWENAAGEHVRNLNMPAYVGGDFRGAGTKIINGNIANPSRGLPRASGLTLLYDDLSVRVQCVMESAYISSLRTASVSVLAATLLQGMPIESVAVIGAGVIAQRHIELLLKYMPALHTVLVYDLVTQNTERLLSELAAQFAQRAVKAQSTTSAEEAIRRAQLIIPATTVTEGYIPYTWLRPGSIVINVSLDDVMPDVVMKADLIVVDDWPLVKHDTRRLIGRMHRAGQVVGPDEALPPGECRRIDAQLGELVTGARPGRQYSEDIILVNPFGLAIEDVALAASVYRVAQEKGLGQFLPY
jgi:N-[(2S)-2-amino-2-carboxyethyl]-L-glutamate dehydrogenase